MARRSRSVLIVKYSLFFYCTGSVIQVPFIEHTSISGQLYAENILSRTDYIVKLTVKPPVVGGSRFFTTVHRCSNRPSFTNYFNENGIVVLSLPSYGPDLASY